MKCIYCQNEITEGTTVCPHCGYDYTQQIDTYQNEQYQEYQTVQQPAQKTVQLPDGVNVFIQKVKGFVSGIISDKQKLKKTGIIAGSVLAVIIALIFIFHTNPKDGYNTAEAAVKVALDAWEDEDWGTLTGSVTDEYLLNKMSYSSETKMFATPDDVRSWAKDYYKTFGYEMDLIDYEITDIREGDLDLYRNYATEAENAEQIVLFETKLVYSKNGKVKEKNDTCFCYKENGKWHCNIGVNFLEDALDHV